MDLPEPCRVTLLLNDRAAVILSWLVFLLIDYGGAKCGEWEFNSQRTKTKTFLRYIWNRYSKSSKPPPSSQ